MVLKCQSAWTKRSAEKLQSQDITACYNHLFCVYLVIEITVFRSVPTVEDEAAPEGKPQDEIKENQQPDGMFTQCLCTTRPQVVYCGFIIEKHKNFIVLLRLLSSYYNSIY